MAKRIRALAERRRTATAEDGHRFDTITVLATDGRVLQRVVHCDGRSTGYTVAARVDGPNLLAAFNDYCTWRGYVR